MKRWLPLYGLLFPGFIALFLFVLYPNVALFQMSFYNWIPSQQETFVGMRNYLDLFADPLLHQSFELVGILLISNLFKIWPAVFAAIVLHRLGSERWRSFYRGLFMVPFVVPTLVWLLVWKSFYDPSYGILNQMLNASGLMEVLLFLDGTPENPGWMPMLAKWVNFGLRYSIEPVLGSAWAPLIGGMFLWRLCLREEEREERSFHYLLFLLISLVPFGIHSMRGSAYHELTAALLVLTLIMLIGWMSRSMPRRWFGWLLVMMLATFIFRHQPFRFPFLLLLMIGLYEGVMSQFHHYRAQEILRKGAIGMMVFGGLILLLGRVWTEPTGEFLLGQPAWLGHEDLVIPAIIFWGFPWVGTIGVLIYLAGLQRIPRSVYEAARMEGVGPWGMVFQVELPLILTQLRINLVFMTLVTLTQYELFLLLLGIHGGPNNRGMVPGLLMFKEAFENSRFGYASAIGVVLFITILGLTLIYNRYLKADR